MNNPQAIQTKIKEIFPDAKYLELYPENTAHFEVQHLDLTFTKLQTLSDFFQTKNINFGKGDSSSGCDTCGHGSYSMVQISIRDINMSNPSDGA
jgi:hypothetical protein